MRAHLFPFLRPGFEDDLYCQLVQLTSAIHEGNKDLSEFYHLARNRWVWSSILYSLHHMLIISSMKTDTQDSSNRHYKFRMMLWLVAYHKFYERKVCFFVFVCFCCVATSSCILLRLIPSCCLLLWVVMRCPPISMVTKAIFVLSNAFFLLISLYNAKKVFHRHTDSKTTRRRNLICFINFLIPQNRMS